MFTFGGKAACGMLAFAMWLAGQARKWINIHMCTMRFSDWSSPMPSDSPRRRPTAMHIAIEEKNEYKCCNNKKKKHAGNDWQLKWRGMPQGIICSPCTLNAPNAPNTHTHGYGFIVSLSIIYLVFFGWRTVKHRVIVSAGHSVWPNTRKLNYNPKRCEGI